MRHGAYIFIALLAALAFGCVSGPKPVVQNTTRFDAANRLTNTITPREFSTTTAFNHQGLMASVKDPLNQTTTYSYDGKGRLTNRSDNVATTLYHYDANNNLTNVTESSLTNAWTYDAYNRASSYRDIYGNVIQYRYDVSGNLTNLIYPGGHTVYYAYDNLNRMTNVTDWSGRVTRIAYDLDGRATSIVRPNGTYRTIAYDAAGEETNILEQNAAGFPIAMFCYNWNANATMQWEFVAPLPPTNALPTRTMTYDADNRLETVDGNSVTLDADGNLTSGPLTNDSFATYAYDARNRLWNVAGVTNAYDALNNRVGQTDGTNTSVFVVDPNTKLSQMLMRIKNGVTNYYVYGPGLLYQVTETAAGTNTLTYHYDYRGSTIALTADNGNVTDRMAYSLYATMTYRLGTNDTPFLFNGRSGVQSDPNGLLYMRARYYNPFLCRFINPDPSGFGGGLNFYAYANGNPVSLTDSFGLDAAATGDISFDWTNPNYAALTANQQTLNDLQDENNDTLENTLDYFANVGQSFQQSQAAQPAWAQQMNQYAEMAVMMVTPEAGALDAGAGTTVAAEETASITTPYGAEVQSSSAEAQAALAQAQNGATLYRAGQTEVSMTGESQYWSLQNPALNPNYANEMGLPGVTPDFIMTGTLNPSASVIANEAGALGANAGKGIQIVTSPGGVGNLNFIMP